jgi:Ser-tRNA(Ala) deacylase AlaX
VETPKTLKTVIEELNQLVEQKDKIIEQEKEERMKLEKTVKLLQQELKSTKEKLVLLQIDDTLYINWSDW